MGFPPISDSDGIVEYVNSEKYQGIEYRFL